MKVNIPRLRRSRYERRRTTAQGCGGAGTHGECQVPIVRAAPGRTSRLPSWRRGDLPRLDRTHRMGDCRHAGWVPAHVRRAVGGTTLDPAPAAPRCGSPPSRRLLWDHHPSSRHPTGTGPGRAPRTGVPHHDGGPATRRTDPVVTLRNARVRLGDRTGRLPTPSGVHGGHRGGPPPRRDPLGADRIAGHQPGWTGRLGHRRPAQRALGAHPRAARPFRHRVLRSPRRGAQQSGAMRRLGRRRRRNGGSSDRPGAHDSDGGTGASDQRPGVRRGVRTGQRHAPAVCGHGRHGPGPRPDTGGARGRPAHLHRPLLRHVARRHLQPGVPDPRSGHGARRCHRPRTEHDPVRLGAGLEPGDRAAVVLRLVHLHAALCLAPGGDPTAALLGLIQQSRTEPLATTGRRHGRTRGRSTTPSWPGSSPSRPGRRWPGRSPRAHRETARRPTQMSTRYDTGGAPNAALAEQAIDCLDHPVDRDPGSYPALAASLGQGSTGVRSAAGLGPPRVRHLARPAHPGTGAGLRPGRPAHPGGRDDRRPGHALCVGGRPVTGADRGLAPDVAGPEPRGLLLQPVCAGRRAVVSVAGVLPPSGTVCSD